MRLQVSVFVLLTANLAQSRSLPNDNLQWTTTCPDITTNSTLPYDCSELQVPLDYDKPASGSLDLQLLRIPSPSQPAKGSILFNFGGPGEEARNTLLLLGPHLQA